MAGSPLPGCWCRGRGGSGSAPLHPSLLPPQTPEQQLLSLPEPRAGFTAHQLKLQMKLELVSSPRAEQTENGSLKQLLQDEKKKSGTRAI